MGWWFQDEDGRSLQETSDLVWGDGPADIIDKAISEIEHCFREKFRRPPKRAEMMAGLLFHLRGYPRDWMPDDAAVGAQRVSGLLNVEPEEGDRAD